MYDHFKNFSLELFPLNMFLVEQLRALRTLKVFDSLVDRKNIKISAKSLNCLSINPEMKALISDR